MKTMATATKWPAYLGPVFEPIDNTLRYRAQSILFGFVDDPLPDTAEEARDIIAWHERTRES